MSERPKVLVKEKIAEAGVDLLRESFDVEVGTDWPDGELESRIGEFDAILIRSATKMTAELIGRATNLRAIGRAGTGVDNVDIEAATEARDHRRQRARSRTRSPPPSTRWRWRWRCSATSRRRTPRSPTASGRARASAATSSTGRRSA